MLAGEMLTLISTRLSNFSINTNRDILLPYLNMGISELYRRFGLSIKEEIVPTCEDKRLYELQNDDVMFLYAIYDQHGHEIPQQDTLDDVGLHYKRVNYRSFLLNEPMEGELFCVYKASPVRIMDDNDEIDIPDPMIDALEGFVTYKVLSIMNNDQVQEASAYRQYYEMMMKDLENQGYGAMADTERFSLHRRGYV